MSDTPVTFSAITTEELLPVVCLTGVTLLVVQSAHVLNSMNATKAFHDITQSPSFIDEGLESRTETCDE